MRSAAARYVMIACVTSACSSSAATHDATVDVAGPVCGELRPPYLAPECVEGGLGTVELDGTWTFAGTFVDYDGFRRDITMPVQMTRTGTGYCAFTLGYDHQVESNRSLRYAMPADTRTYADDDRAFAGSAMVCGIGDGSLSFHQTISMFVGEGNLFRNIDGTLTR